MLYPTSPTAPMFGLRWPIDRLFEDTFGRGRARLNEWTPAVDITETDQELNFAVELPGFRPENVEVSAVDGVLTIQGERPEERKADEAGRYHLVERNYGSFVRRFQLPHGVDYEKIEADVTQGLLQVRIPKAALPQPKRIQIKAGVDVTSSKQQAIGRGESRENSAKKAGAAHQSK
jgi:HSP20 family protein